MKSLHLIAMNIYHSCQRTKNYCSTEQREIEQQSHN